MRRLLAILWAGLGALSLGHAALAQDASLRRLDTRDATRGWEAVGQLDLGGKGFCTGALIAEDLVLTAAHCLFDKQTGAAIDPATIRFLAGWRNGRAEAYRGTKRAVAHPDYTFDANPGPDRVRHDIALVQLDQPIRTGMINPFATDAQPRRGQEVGVVSYAHDRADAPSLQRVCTVRDRLADVLVMSCDVDFGSSGAPVFAFGTGRPRIVSVVSAKAELDGAKVSLGTDLDGTLPALKQALRAQTGLPQVGPGAQRVGLSNDRSRSSAKFIRPGG